MQLEPRPHGKRPVMKDGVWDEEAWRDLRQRLDRAGVRSAAPVIWNVRGIPTRVHKAEQAPKGERMSWTNGQVRDRGVSVEDALLAASWLRSKCTTTSSARPRRRSQCSTSSRPVACAAHIAGTDQGLGGDHAECRPGPSCAETS
jgi:hypothetical protein